jgi:hypothetical protein
MLSSFTALRHDVISFFPPAAACARSVATLPRAATAAEASREIAVEGQPSPPGRRPRFGFVAASNAAHEKNGSAGRVGADVARGTRRDSEGGALAEYSQPVGMNTESG